VESVGKVVLTVPALESESAGEGRGGLFGKKHREGGLEPLLLQDVVPGSILGPLEDPLELVILAGVLLLHLHRRLDHLVVVPVHILQQLYPFGLVRGLVILGMSGLRLRLLRWVLTVILVVDDFQRDGELGSLSIGRIFMVDTSLDRVVGALRYSHFQQRQPLLDIPR